MVIVTSPVNSVDSRRLLHEFRSFSYTKVLVIDITGSIFSRRNHFSGYLATKEELDFVVEHWSENNFYSTSRTTNTPLPVSGQTQNGTPHNNHRYKRSSSSSAVQEDPPLVRQQPKAGKVQSEQKGRETVKEGDSSNRQKSKTTPEGTDQKVVVVDPKPQNFLILTVLTDKLKTLHDRALHVEFEQHYKLSRSGVMEPFRGNGQGEREASSAISSSPNGNAEDPYQLQRRKQMKRSEEIIVTVNGTRNCNTTATASTPDQHAETASLKASATHAGNGPKSGDSAEDDCVENKREDADEDNLRNGADEEKGRLLISKLPIFTSLTSSINESIQLLLVYAGQSNCSLSSGEGGGGGLEVAVQECVSALKCVRVSDGNEQLFCNYLCRSVVNHSYNRESGTSEPKTDPTVDTVTPSPAVLQEDSERFSTVSDMVVAIERVCRSMTVDEEELSLRNESSEGGGVAIQMQFSENLLYFYNENVVSKNNELVKRHKSKPMPNQTQQPHYPAKDHPFPPNPHRVLKRSVGGVREASPPEEKIARLVAGSSMVDKRHADVNAAADEPDMIVTDEKDDAARNGHHHNESATAASHYAKYSEYFSLFDYIVATTASNWNASVPALRVDFIILDFQSVITTTTSNDVDDVQNGTELGWRPFLIMQQSSVNPRLFTTHSILPGYNDWTLIPTQNFMECGLLCIGVIALAIAILCSIFVGGIVSAITIR